MKKDYLYSECKIEFKKVYTTDSFFNREIDALFVETPDNKILLIYVWSHKIFSGYTPTYIRVWETQSNKTHYNYLAEFSMSLKHTRSFNNSFDCEILTPVQFTEQLIREESFVYRVRHLSL